MTVSVAVTATGRMSLPADIRKRLGLVGGGSVIVEETPDGVMLRTVSQAVAYAQALAKRYTDGNADTTVAAFLANRKSKAASELGCPRRLGLAGASQR